MSNGKLLENLWAQFQLTTQEYTESLESHVELLTGVETNRSEELSRLLSEISADSSQHDALNQNRLDFNIEAEVIL